MARSKLLRLAQPAFGKKIPWYLKGGVAKAHCLAAYQAIGAASQAASYVNLVTPGTHDLSTASAPTWNAGTGWTFASASAQYVASDIVPADPRNYTIIVRYSGCTADSGYVMGSANIGTGDYFAVAPRRTSQRRYINGGATGLSVAAYSASGVIALAGANPYMNGVSDGTVTTSAGTYTLGIRIGGNGNGSHYWTGNVQAAAIYNSVLTAAQVLAITNAMGALPFEIPGSVSVYPGPTPPEQDDFMIVYFGDCHTGSSVTGIADPDEVTAMFEYINVHAQHLGIKMVLLGGDMTDQIEDHATEQAIYTAALEKLNNVPHLQALGNHEYQATGGARNATLFNTNIPQSHYTSKSWWNGGFFEDGHTENAYLLRTIDGVDYIFISLEWFPREAVIDWADALLTTYATRKAILFTHAYEYEDGSAFAVGDPLGPDYYTEITGSDYHWGTEVWSELLNIHDNAILIQSGHVSGPAKHVANSAGGQPVHQVLYNNQFKGNWTSTAIRFMVINKTTETIEVETFSPIQLGFLSGATDQFTLSY